MDYLKKKVEIVPLEWAKDLVDDTLFDQVANKVDIELALYKSYYTRSKMRPLERRVASFLLEGYSIKEAAGKCKVSVSWCHKVVKKLACYIQ